jgi:hypothetical protein
MCCCINVSCARGLQCAGVVLVCFGELVGCCINVLCAKVLRCAGVLLCYYDRLPRARVLRCAGEIMSKIQTIVQT